MPIDTFMAYVGVYGSVDDAEADYAAVKALATELNVIDAYDAAVIERNDKGKVKIVKKHETPTRVGGVLGGGVGLATGLVIVLFPAAAIGGGLLLGHDGRAVPSWARSPATRPPGMSRSDLKDLGEHARQGPGRPGRRRCLRHGGQDPGRHEEGREDRGEEDEGRHQGARGRRQGGRRLSNVAPRAVRVPAQARRTAGRAPRQQVRRVKHALYLPPFAELADPRVLRDLAAAAEESGWEGFFLWDHVLRPPDEVHEIADVWVSLAAVAAATTTLRLGPMVTPLVRRRVQKVAREVVTLDLLSSGRLTVGLGLGVDSGGELSKFGELTDERARGDLLDEGAGLLDALDERRGGVAPRRVLHRRRDALPAPTRAAAAGAALVRDPRRRHAPGAPQRPATTACSPSRSTATGCRGCSTWSSPNGGPSTTSTWRC